jgi:translation elongation factor P/translation initiation factor 5A
MTITVEGEPNKIVEFSHSKQARGAASTNARFKNLVTGNTLTKTIKASESFDPAQIDRVDAQHTCVRASAKEERGGP